MSAKTQYFTADQIKAAHAKVRSGADFPNYIKEIKLLGVTGYTSYVEDGHVDYFGEDNHRATVPAKYNRLPVAEKTDIDAFKADLKAHQLGKTNFPTFCNDCAKSGIEKWLVNIDAMTCTYYNKAGQPVLVEKIPG